MKEHFGNEENQGKARSKAREFPNKFEEAGDGVIEHIGNFLRGTS
ncbi:MAG: hypothetical protein ABEK59_06590 [Halobacteria archaeon]